MKKIFCLLPLWAICSATQIRAGEWTDGETAGGRRELPSNRNADGFEVVTGVWIPAPDGYVKIHKGTELYNAVKQVDDGEPWGESLAYFCRTNSLLPGGETVFTKLLRVRMPPQFAGRRFSNADFRAFADSIKNSILSGEAQKFMRESLEGKTVVDSGVDIKFCESTYFPLFEDSGNAFGFGLMTRLEMPLGEYTVSSYLVVVKREVYVNGAIFELVESAPGAALSEENARKLGLEFSCALEAWHDAIRALAEERAGDSDLNRILDIVDLEGMLNRTRNIRDYSCDINASTDAEPFDKWANWMLREIEISLLAVFAVLLIVNKCFKRESRDVADGAVPIPLSVQFVVAWLIVTCLGGIVSTMVSSSPFRYVQLTVFVALKPLIVWAILKRYRWPRILMLVFGLLSLTGGFVERYTNPSEVWNALSVGMVVGGFTNLFMYALLIAPKAENWRRNLQKQCV